MHLVYFLNKLFHQEQPPNFIGTENSSNIGIGNSKTVYAGKNDFLPAAAFFR